MSDGAVSSPEMSLAPQGETLRGKEGVSLYKSSRFNVFVPLNPNIPLNEGLHIEVSSGHDSEDSPREVLERYLMALGSAKVLAESGKTPDAWANTRLEQGQTVSTYGRVPEVENSWRKPVNTSNRVVPEMGSLEPNYGTQKLQELFGRYLPGWEHLADNIELFKNGVDGEDINKITENAVTIWENNRFELDVAIIAPHVKGLHLVVNPKKNFQRQWQTVGGQNEEQTYIQQTLEATAIAMGVQKLLAEGKGEIHNSGNWAGGLKTTQEGGKLDMKKFVENRKIEKRTHTQDIGVTQEQIKNRSYVNDPFNTSIHAQVLLPTEGSVILPEMSESEAKERGKADIVAQWGKEVRSDTTPAQLEEIKTKLGEGKLTKWLEENCQGHLIS